MCACVSVVEFFFFLLAFSAPPSTLSVLIEGDDVCVCVCVCHRRNCTCSTFFFFSVVVVLEGGRFIHYDVHFKPYTLFFFFRVDNPLSFFFFFQSSEYSLWSRYCFFFFCVCVCVCKTTRPS